MLMLLYNGMDDGNGSCKTLFMLVPRTYAKKRGRRLQAAAAVAAAAAAAAASAHTHTQPDGEGPRHE